MIAGNADTEFDRTHSEHSDILAGSTKGDLSCAKSAKAQSAFNAVHLIGSLAQDHGHLDQGRQQRRARQRWPATCGN
jgi:hypothetical protein